MKTIFASALSLLLFMPSVGQCLDVTEPDSFGRIGNWMVLGPFDHDGCFVPLADVLDPETTVPCLGDTEVGKTWEAYVPAELDGEWVSQCIDFPVGSCNGGRGIDLNCHYSGDIRTHGLPNFVMAYAFTYLIVDSDMDVQIRTGSDDGYRYYLDGDLIVDEPDACRCYADDQEIVNVTLTAGIHRVLVQVGEAAGHWGFTFRITDTSGNPITSGIRAELTGDDSDSDGVPDCDDSCPDSDLSDTVVIDGCDTGVANTLFSDGCTISDLIALCAGDAKNHGQFVQCVAHLTNALKSEGVITGKEKGAIQSCAAQADIP